MDAPFATLPHGKIAYIRQIAATTLPEEIRAQLPGDVLVWGVHDTNGACLAVARDRSVAFSLARLNDFAPVSAH